MKTFRFEVTGIPARTEWEAARKLERFFKKMGQVRDYKQLQRLVVPFRSFELRKEIELSDVEHPERFLKPKKKKRKMRP